MSQYKFAIKFASAAVLFIVIFSAAGKAQELKADEIIAKHLDSIGTKAARDAVTNQMALGTSSFESKLPPRKTTGKSLIVSEGRNLYFLASLASNEYPFEKVGYFNDKISLPPVINGNDRSPLGHFLAEHEKILSDGLFTGSISSTWALFNAKTSGAVIKSEGVKKVDGKKVYVLEYFPKGVGSIEFTIRLFFDAATFQHVRTEYVHSIASGEDTFGQLGRQAGVKIRLIEQFGDFKEENGLTLPHTYKIDYLTDSNSGTYEWDWGFTISQYQFNRKYDPKFFSFDN